ncbi:MAG TPA: carboxypeptidase-like regulatory domain-containing protein [Candidatus Acidoferrum sp.]|nr:carboxypeptidase-like regulatory domain-containing protein [Candidatus Acidoferrum sp.]
MISRIRARFSRSAAFASANSRLVGAGLRTILLVAILGLSGAITNAASAQDQGPELRTVHGTVINTAENPVASAIVYLKNMKTQDVKTYITREDGLYRFSGLDPNVDYQVFAEHSGMVSSTRDVSSYDSRRDIDFQLKLSHKKPST